MQGKASTGKTSLGSTQWSKVSFYSASARYFQSLQYAGAASSESPSCTSLDVSDVEVHYSFYVHCSFRHSLEFLLEIGLTTYLTFEKLDVHVLSGTYNY